MIKSNAIIIEGIMGSGKTTTAEYVANVLQDKGFDAKFIKESDWPHPVRLRLDLEEGIGDWRTPWLDFTVEQCIQWSLEKWQSFVAQAKTSPVIYVFDGQLFHGDMTRLMYMDAERETIIRQIHDISQIAQAINPVLIYFYQNDVETFMRKTFKARGDEWKAYQVDWKANSPYCQQRNLHGFEGLIQMYQDYRALTDELFADLTFKKLAIENSAGDWDQYYEEIVAFLFDEGKQLIVR